MARETWVQSQVESYQRLKKWYLMPPCLTLSIIRYGSRVKWSNPGKGVAPSPTPWCSKLSKRKPSGHPRLWSPILLTKLLWEFHQLIPAGQRKINTANRKDMYINMLKKDVYIIQWNIYIYIYIYIILVEDHGQTFASFLYEYAVDREFAFSSPLQRDRSNGLTVFSGIF